METRPVRSVLAGLTPVLLAGCLGGTGAADAPAARSTGGGAFTTFDRTLGGCLDSTIGINCNHYTARDRVYLSGGPAAAGLADGAYYFAVLAPGAQNDGFREGAVGNLSDAVGGAGFTAGDLGSGDPIANRAFVVSGHEIVAYGGTHARGVNPAGRAVLALAPFDDTPNAGGVYVLAICQVSATSPSQCKFDSFHIDPPADGGDAATGDVFGGDATSGDGGGSDAPESDGGGGDAAGDLPTTDGGSMGDAAMDGPSSDVTPPDGATGDAATDGGSPCATSTIRSNFNGTAIAPETWVWFSAAGRVRRPAGGLTLRVEEHAIDFTAGGAALHLAVPSARVTFSPTATTATTSFDATRGAWSTTVPAGYDGDVFLTGVALRVGAGGLPGGINPVVWTGTFVSDTAGVSVAWQWAAAVYTRFSDDPGALDVKPVEGGSLSAYANADHAGTPERFRPYVTGGARGGGGSNFTGSLSATSTASACVRP
ncbi:MAG: hypothetical protein U0324_35315 [Polyangiales bacterium]